MNSGLLQFRLTSDPEVASRPTTAGATKVSSVNVKGSRAYVDGLFLIFQKRKINLGLEKPKKKVRREDGGMKTDEYPKTR